LQDKNKKRSNGRIGGVAPERWAKRYRKMKQCYGF